MFDDYDGIDYSHSNPPPDPSLKWDTDQGIAAMQQVWDVALQEMRDAIGQVPEGDALYRVRCWEEAFYNYINLRPGTRGAKSYVDWVQRTIPHDVPLFSMTFGQMFEEAIRQRGLHPYNSTQNQTFWTGNWMSRVKGVRPKAPYEGYGIVTRPHGWSVIYQEDRSRGLSAGMIGGRIRVGRWAEKREGILVRTVTSHWYPSGYGGFKVYPQNMDVLHSPGSSRHHLERYIHLYGDETYEGAIERVLGLAAAVADFMNDRDFHVLEDLKREIRRHEQARPVIESEMFSTLEKEVPDGLLDLLGEAAVMSEQLHLGKRAYDLFKVFYSGRWDGKGWRDVTDRHGRRWMEEDLPETLDPDHINIHHALKLGSYPVEEWLRMPVVDEDGEVAVPEFEV